VEPLNV